VQRDATNEIFFKTHFARHTYTARSVGY
jgi:hypothetical protein